MLLQRNRQQSPKLLAGLGALRLRPDAESGSRIEWPQWARSTFAPLVQREFEAASCPIELDALMKDLGQLFVRVA